MNRAFYWSTTDIKGEWNNEEKSADRWKQQRYQHQLHASPAARYRAAEFLSYLDYSDRFYHAEVCLTPDSATN